MIGIFKKNSLFDTKNICIFLSSLGIQTDLKTEFHFNDFQHK